MKKTLKLMTLNIGNPSLKRVKQQIEWIEHRDEDVFVLTETKLSEGCQYLEEYFTNETISFFNINKEPQFHVFFPKSKTGDLGVMILSKFPIVRTRTCFKENEPFFSRLLDVSIDFYSQEIGIMGLYVPSRDSSNEKIKRKKDFIIDYLNYLKTISKDNEIPYVICGDLNILEKNHLPHYKNFIQWEYDFYDRFDHFGYVDAFRYMYPNKNEYSWVGRTNDGYRYDHCFVSKQITKNIVDCYYIHETRKIPITDHSAMALTIEI